MQTHTCIHTQTWHHIHTYALWEETGHHIGGGDSYLHMWDGLSLGGGALVAVEIFFILSFFHFFSFFLNTTLPRNSIGTIITLKICRDKIEKSSSLHYLPLQLLEIIISKCDFHHLLLIKPRDQIFTKLPELKLLEELRIKLSFHRGTRKKWNEA